MSDLISRKALLIEFNSMEMPAIDIITGVIESQPTAYDPDKVVEALEKEHQEAKKEYNLDVHSYYEGKMIAFDNAIEIVKKGGVE